jgi:propionate CoA-transferase
MRRSKRVSFEEAAAKTVGGATVSVSTSSGLACPDAMQKAIGDRFRVVGEPRGLTMIHPIASLPGTYSELRLMDERLSRP